MEFITKLSVAPLALGAVTVYITYYLVCVVRKPQIFTKPRSAFSQFIVEHCAFVHQLYWPTFWCFEGRAQTVVGSLMKTSPRLSYKRQLLATPDGGEVALDWVDKSSPTSSPTVLILPGLTGTSNHEYILHFANEITKNIVCNVVVLNNRGLSGVKLKTPHVCCAADTADIEFVISHINKTRPRVALVVVGISLGGIILTNYLCKLSERKACTSSDVFGAAVISTPWNLFKSSESLEQPLNYLLFNRHLTRLLHNVVRQNLLASDMVGFQIPWDLDHVLNSSTVREFDDRFIAPMCGFKNCTEYYTAATLHTKPLDKISVPLLCLNAADDPFAPEGSLPLRLFQRCVNVAMILTRHGGHIGFTEGFFPRGAGYMEKVVVQYIHALLEHWSETHPTSHNYHINP